MSDALSFAVIEIHTSPWEAHVSRALLESEGIPAFLASEHHVGAIWPMSLMLGGVRLLVPAGYSESARSVLTLRDSGQLLEALVQQFPPSRRNCARCGSVEFVERRNWSSVALAVLLLLFCKVTYPPTKDKQCVACGSFTG